ncbi:MAG TPA: hypothetical protein VKZ87_11435 [Ferrovibrio sp.]|jgi:hypothetical protein|uniref:hypothetical protein n=1 Tax=Ferrovibrio sp. TaxID=1917215 RepID=UPI002B4B59B8|nr:hypothetical protein [Ferrovibrio sp.]HLT77992.1 hypothetical protein [Ferrovibrio sp.]
MLSSSILGIIGSLLLAWSPLHDVAQRFRILRDEYRANRASSRFTGALRKACAEGLEMKRNTFNIPDAVANLLGALLLVAAFVVEYSGG